LRGLEMHIECKSASGGVVELAGVLKTRPFYPLTGIADHK